MSADSGIQDVDPVEHVLPGFFTGPIALRLHVFRFPRLSSHSKCNTTGPAGLRGCQANEILSTDECRST